MSSENSDVDDIAEKLHQVHIERHRLHEKEQALIRQLIEAQEEGNKTNEGAGGAPLKWTTGKLIRGSTE